MPRALDFALSRILPEDLRKPTYDVSKNGMGNMMTEIARKYPERYAEISQKIGDLGRRASFLQGYTIGPEDTAGVIDTDRYLGQMDAEMDHLKSQDLSPEEFEDARSEIFLRYSKLIEGETMKAAKLSGNSFAKAVISGARGNPAHVQAILSTPGVYSDAKGNVIPLFVRNSFSRGVRPAESLAGTYGARQAVVATKVATAKGGDFGKILVQSAANYNVVERDCGSRNGIDLPADDNSLRGRVLARDVGEIKAGTVLDKHALAQLRRLGKPVVVRSAMTCAAGEGLCSKCVGLNADGHFPKIGESVGITAAQAVSEPIVQGALSTKHNAGQAKGKKSFSGFDYISQFVQIPEEFKDRAAVSEEDGVVEAIREAPQGGHFIVINGREHFALPGFEVNVKPGESVEKGDILSDGLANPADIVRLRGLGEGRRYYADRLSQILDDSGQTPDRRNLEIIAKATVDHYRMDDPDEDSPYNPDDLVRSSEFLRKYKPPKDTSDFPMHKVQGKYLQQSVLHFTPGTRLTPKMIRRMEDAGVSSVLASNTAPSFSPDMRRLRVASHTGRDWLASMHTSYLSKQLVDSVERGDETNIESNRHFAPRLAYGKDFGKNTDTTGKF